MIIEVGNVRSPEPAFRIFPFCVLRRNINLRCVVRGLLRTRERSYCIVDVRIEVRSDVCSRLRISGPGTAFCRIVSRERARLRVVESGLCCIDTGFEGIPSVRDCCVQVRVCCAYGRAVIRVGCLNGRCIRGCAALTAESQLAWAISSPR